MQLPVRKFVTSRYPFPLVVSMTAMLAIAGCGAASSPQGQVASIPSTAPAGSASARPGPSSPATGSSAADSGTGSRPVERLDDTPQQIDALIQAWNQCLVAHGATYGIAPGVAGSQNLTNIPASAKAACLGEEPEGPPQLDPSQNPNYRADSLANVACMRAHGIMVHLVADTSVYADGLSWTFDAGLPSVPADLGKVQQLCQEQAFGGRQ